jgi:hypothetical protein
MSILNYNYSSSNFALTHAVRYLPYLVSPLVLSKHY